MLITYFTLLQKYSTYRSRAIDSHSWMKAAKKGSWIILRGLFSIKAAQSYLWRFFTNIFVNLREISDKSNKIQRKYRFQFKQWVAVELSFDCWPLLNRSRSLLARKYFWLEAAAINAAFTVVRRKMFFFHSSLFQIEILTTKTSN